MQESTRITDIPLAAGGSHDDPGPRQLAWAVALRLLLAPGFTSIPVFADGNEAPHWAYQPPRQEALPEGRHPIDHYVRLRLRQQGESPLGRFGGE